MIPDALKRPLLIAVSSVIMLATVIGVLLLVDELSGDSDDAIGFGEGPGIWLDFEAPKDRETLSSPVTVKVKSANVTIADPAEGVAGAYHYHIQVDTHPFTPGGQAVPDGPNDYHFWEDSIELDLDPGNHTLVLLLGDNDHIRPFDAPAQFISIYVE